jgi:hypothetical protein
MSRLEARAVIIHMRSSFHKRAAMVILRRELASQRLPGTTVRDCFPTIMMSKVKRLNRLGMELKTAGKITKFQVINRKGQPILQTGQRNQNYADYQGNIEEEEEEAANSGEWTLVESRRKRPHPDNTLTSPNSRPLTADRPVNSQPPPTAATWAALTDQEFPELGNQAKPANEKQQQVTAKPAAQPAPAAQQRKNQPGGGPAGTLRGPQQQTSWGPVEATRGGQQQQPSREIVETPSGSQPGSYPASRAGSQHNRRPSRPHQSGAFLMTIVVIPGTLESRCRRGNYLPSVPNIFNTLGKAISLIGLDLTPVIKLVLDGDSCFVEQTVN